MKAAALAGNGVRSLAAALGLLLAAQFLQCSPAPRQVNVILVTLDTTRADHLGCYGCTVASTPVIDRLAAEAVLFENAVTAVPLTLPAHASILTGMSPLGHGVHNNGSFQLHARHETLAEMLAKEGYTTAAFVSCYVLERRFGLAQGFETFDDRLAAQERPATETTVRATRWLESGPRHPFFLWVHYFDPHRPLEPPEPFASDTRGTPYDAEISAMDASLGDLIEVLKRLGLYKDAHIVVLADHGEGLGDHREHEHGIFLYEECLHIPLLWKLPGARRSHRNNALAGVVDVVPTVLDFLGVTAPTELAGLSLKDLLLHGRAPQRPGLYAETLYPLYSYDWSPLYVWRTPEWKYVQAPQSELYHLAVDPREAHDLSSARVQKAADLAAQLQRYRSQRGADRSVPVQGAVDAETAEHLLSLGYVSSTTTGDASSVDMLPDPKSKIALHEEFELARHAFQDRRYAEAVQGCERVLADYPDNHSATYLMSQALLEVGRPQEALAWLHKHMRGTAEPNASILKGKILLALDRAGDALDWLRNHRHGKAQQVVAQKLIGDALVHLDRLEEALNAYARSAAMRPVASVAQQQALTLARLQRFDQAAQRFEEAAHLSPTDERDAWDHWIRAAQHLAVHGVKTPVPAEQAFVAQVRAAADLGLLEAARNLLDTAGPPRSRTLRMQLEGDLAIAARDWSAAREAYLQAERMGARSQELYLRHAMACLETDDLQAAAAVLERGTRVSPDPEGLLHYNLACTLARQGELERAMAALEAALSHGYGKLSWLREDADLAALRRDPRFQQLVSRGAQAPSTAN